jgi:hypothetical protein
VDLIAIGQRKRRVQFFPPIGTWLTQKETIHRIIRFKLFILLCQPLASLAEEHWYNYDHLYLEGGTYIHYDPDDDYKGPRLFVGLSAVKANDWIYGLALFNNSFDQFSQYVYAGKRWNFPGSAENFHAKITAGLIHGYKGEFKDKIPNNGTGIAPAIIPGLGYKKGRFGGDIYVLGISGLLFTVGMDF